MRSIISTLIFIISLYYSSSFDGISHQLHRGGKIYDRSHLGRTSKVSFPADLHENNNVDNFFDVFVKFLGNIRRKHMNLRHKVETVTGDYVFEHYDQYLNGHKVYGGEIILHKQNVGSGHGHSNGNGNGHGNILHARGNTLPRDKSDKLLKLKISGVLDDEENVEPQLDESSAVEHLRFVLSRKVNKNVDSIDIEIQSSESTWYRVYLPNGSFDNDDVTLAYHLIGKVVSKDSKRLSYGGRKVSLGLYSFESFVDADTGRVLKLRDTTIGGMKDESVKMSNTPEDVTSSHLRKSTRKINKDDSAKSNRRLLSQPDLSGMKLVVVDCQGSSNSNLWSIIFDSAQHDLNAQDEQTKLALYTTGQTVNFFNSISNQDRVAPEKLRSNPNTYYVVYRNWYERNAFFAPDSVDYASVYHDSFLTDDVVGHEWMHAYTEYSGAPLIYEFQSGALNEALSDIFGESIDIENEAITGNQDDNMVNSRNSAGTECVAGHYNSNVWPSYTETGSERFIMGEEIDNGGSSGNTGIRDMYKPECFGHPNDVDHLYYYCEPSADYYIDYLGLDQFDYGGVHINSGVLNRVFAVLYNGGNVTRKSDYTTVTIPSISKEKLYGLFYETSLALNLASQFDDFADTLESICDAKVAGSNKQYFVADIQSGTSVLSGIDVNTTDCQAIRDALDASGMHKSISSYCSTAVGVGATMAAESTLLCDIVDTWANLGVSSDLYGWHCTSGLPTSDPCQNKGAWKGLFCEGVGVNNLANSSVTVIDLSGDYVVNPSESSTIPSNIGALDQLKLLDVSNNGLSGTLPISIGQLIKLEQLDLSSNSLSGDMPEELCTLLMYGNLYSLDLLSNPFACKQACLGTNYANKRLPSGRVPVVRSVVVNYDDNLPDCTSSSSNDGSGVVVNVWVTRWPVTVSLTGIDKATFTAPANVEVNVLAFRSAIAAAMGSDIELSQVLEVLIYDNGDASISVSLADMDVTERKLSSLTLDIQATLKIESTTDVDQTSRIEVYNQALVDSVVTGGFTTNLQNSGSSSLSAVTATQASTDANLIFTTGPSDAEEEDGKKDDEILDLNTILYILAGVVLATIVIACYNRMSLKPATEVPDTQLMAVAQPVAVRTRRVNGAVNGVVSVRGRV